MREAMAVGEVIAYPWKRIGEGKNQTKKGKNEIRRFILDAKF